MMFWILYHNERNKQKEIRRGGVRACVLDLLEWFVMESLFIPEGQKIKRGTL